MIRSLRTRIIKTIVRNTRLPVAGRKLPSGKEIVPVLLPIPVVSTAALSPFATICRILKR